MKKILLLAILFLTGAMIIWSQVPQAMTYKAVAKDDWGVALPNKTITLRFTILQGSGTGSTVYQETHTTVTNKFGLMDVEIGKGTSVIGSFDMIDWSIGIYYIQIEMDPNGGTNFRLEDPAHQLLSVPYALFAESSGNASFTESDPVFAASSSSGIWSSDIFNWNTAFSWGNHANEGYLKGFTESDPLFLLHPAHGIAIDNINNWNAAFSWGNHAGLYKPLDYSPAWSEITGNPFLISSPLSNQLLRYNDLIGRWENWMPNFLTLEGDSDPENEIQTISINGSEISLSHGGGSILIPTAGYQGGQYFYADKDNDGFGNHFSPVWVPNGINQPANFILNDSDCNDENGSINPGATEIYGDQIDQNCDGRDVFDPNEGIWKPGDLWIDPQDNYSYKTTRIGDQVWMAENLKTNKYNDGQPLTKVSSYMNWNKTTSGSYCWYADDSLLYEGLYGKLYNSQAITSGKLCPIGWRLPSEEDWIKLTNYLGGVDHAGGRLKEDGFAHWIPPNSGATNVSGFSGLPGGMIRFIYYQLYDSYVNLGYSGHWWCSDPIDIPQFWSLYYDSCSFSGNFQIASHVGASVRCLRDIKLESDPEIDDDNDGFTENQGDCNDTNSSISPAAQEQCGDGIDQDCSGSDALCDYETDNDNDGWDEQHGDCDDTNPTINPLASEICGDGIDQDCNGSDEICPEDRDDDGDGFSPKQGDCSDYDSSIYPGAIEICMDEIDQDCDGSDLLCDTDRDNDGISDSIDNCLSTPNPDQSDVDNDGFGDVCSSSPSETVVDIDGNIYNTINIGSQTWMAENLSVTRYNNGDFIKNITEGSIWSDYPDEPAYCWYLNDEVTYKDVCGALYTQYVIRNGNICPAGWHVPSTEEWNILKNFLILNGYGYGGYGNDIAKSLASKSGWNSTSNIGSIGYDQPSNNSSGFSAIPAGYRGYYNVNFTEAGYSASWWCDKNSTSIFRIYAPSGFLDQTVADAFGEGRSIRCVKD